MLSIDVLSRLPSVVRWAREGCSGPAPHVLKKRIVKAYLDRFGIRRFVETGTYKGDTLAFIAKAGIPCTSIELSTKLYEAARERFRECTNVDLVYGDSAEKLPLILERIEEPVLFWLDGHYSAGETALGSSHTPISKELQAILDHPIKRHVILIDDARCFVGLNGYPHIDELLRDVRMNGNYAAETSTDIIRLIPKI